jgi:hypothetical protein
MVMRTSWWRAALFSDPQDPGPPDDEPGHGHAVYLYSEEDELLDRLESYVLDGDRHGQRTILFAEHERMKLLRLRLSAWQVDIEPHEATWALQRFTVDGRVDEERFRAVVGEVLARHEAGTVRLYGEMVGVLWRRGERQEALRLEAAWNGWLADNPGVPLLCAYARDEIEPFAEHAAVCQAHSDVFPELAA